MFESNDFYNGYRKGKIDTIKTLEEVLESMKSQNQNTTAKMFNGILDEVLKNFLAELI